jgi:tetratricopeptide (TPR) repeat protein
LDHALELYQMIEKRKPDEARWPHRKGELLCRMGRLDEAVVAYERAVHLYAAKGFVERAAATAKVLLAIDPTRTDVLERLEAEAADAFHHPLFHRSGTHLHHGR